MSGEESVSQADNASPPKRRKPGTFDSETARQAAAVSAERRRARATGQHEQPTDADVIAALRKSAGKGDAAAARELRAWLDRPTAASADNTLPAYDDLTEDELEALRQQAGHLVAVLQGLATASPAEEALLSGVGVTPPRVREEPSAPQGEGAPPRPMESSPREESGNPPAARHIHQIPLPGLTNGDEDEPLPTLESPTTVEPLLPPSLDIPEP